jgi:hypothetical protein
MLLPVNLHRPAPLLLALLLAACGGGSSSSGLPEGVWTWVDVPGTACSDGSPTGLAINPAPGGSVDLVIYLEGGGACWDEYSCSHDWATSGPFGKVQFDVIRSALGGILFTRGTGGAPFADATQVYIPYCTGDVHWGNAVKDYVGYGTWHHSGQPNLEADVGWLWEHVAAPARLVVTGSSAGGFGTLLAHDLARTAWPDAKGYLVDDSGPPLVGDDIASDLRTAWFDSWGLATTVTPLCPDCGDDLSLVVDALAAKYPDDRLALLSTLRDGTISWYLGLSADQFQAALLQLVNERIAPHANARAFVVTDSAHVTDHVLLWGRADYTSESVTLADWLGQMLSDDAGWSTLGMP